MKGMLLTVAFMFVAVGGMWWAQAHAAEVAATSKAFPETATPDPPIPSPTRKFDEYGNIHWGDERARLDNFAIELQNDPLAQGYIICYGGKVGRAGEAQRRCYRAMSYINRQRGIEASRIVTVDGGYKEELNVELWAVPSGATPPVGSPTVDPREVRFIKGKPKKRARRR
jgi:hypothetical protein